MGVIVCFRFVIVLDRLGALLDRLLSFGDRF